MEVASVQYSSKQQQSFNSAALFLPEPGCIIAVPFRTSALFFPLSKALDFACLHRTLLVRQLVRASGLAVPELPAHSRACFNLQGALPADRPVASACTRTSPTDQVPIADSRSFELHTPPPALLLACLSIRIPSAGPHHRWSTRWLAVLPSAPTARQASSGRVASLAVSVSLVTCGAQGRAAPALATSAKTARLHSSVGPPCPPPMPSPRLTQANIPL